MKGDFTRWTCRPEMHYHGVLKQQGRVDLDADWNEQSAITTHRVETEALDVIGPCGAPAAAAGFALSAAQNGAKLMIGKGRAYVDGILIENEADVAIDAQPDLPGLVLPKPPGVYLAYLEVFLRHITMLDDPEIREVALGGPDTCTRAKTVWQVKLLSGSSTDKGFDCTSRSAAWDALIAPSTGTLAARAEPDPTAADPCTIPVKAGYRRLENQLYRVEVHNGSLPGPATFKWSRDNGSVIAKAVRWTSQTSDHIEVNSVGRDAVVGFAAGEWIELIDDTHELQFNPGTLVKIKSVTGNTIELDKTTATGSIDPKDFPVNPKIRRWDSVGNLPALAKAAHGSWLNLESGVQVEFGGGNNVTGDYWLIPARTLTGDVDWPEQGGNPVAQLPKGVRRHYCRLAVVQLQGAVWSVTANCLPIFKPLGSVPAVKAIHVTGVNLIGANATVTPLNNDDTVSISALRGTQIEALFDLPISPVCARPPTCFLTVDVPLSSPTGSTSGQAPHGFQPLILNEDIALNPAGNGVRFALNSAAFTYLSAVLNSPTARILAHLTLKGAKIWSRDDPFMYLDGVAFGILKSDSIGLRLPSGAGRPVSDFEMWFWLSH